MNVFIILLALFMGCIVSSTETPNVSNKKTLESIVPSATSQEYSEQSGGDYPPAGTQVIMNGKIYEYGSTPGIMPRLVGDAPPPPWEIASDSSKPLPKSKPN